MSAWLYSSVGEAELQVHAARLCDCKMAQLVKGMMTGKRSRMKFRVVFAMNCLQIPVPFRVYTHSVSRVFRGA